MSTDDAKTLAEIKRRFRERPLFVDENAVDLADALAIAERLLARVPPEGGDADDTGTPGPTPVATPPVCERWEDEELGLTCKLPLPCPKHQAAGVPPSSPDVEAIRGRVQARAHEASRGIAAEDPRDPDADLAEIHQRAEADALAACSLADAARAERDKMSDAHGREAVAHIGTEQRAEQAEAERDEALKDSATWEGVAANEGARTDKAEAALAQAQREREALRNQWKRYIDSGGLTHLFTPIKAWLEEATAPTGAQGAQGGE